MWCDDHRSLLQKYQTTTATYADMVEKLQAHARNIPQVEFMLLWELAERARQRCEAAHRLLHRHIEEHGC